MKFVGTILYIEFKELVSTGVSGLTIRTAKAKKRASWYFIQDPDDSRKVLIEYEKLKPKYKELLL